MPSNPYDPKRNNALLSPDEAIAQYESAVASQPSAANYLELGAAYYIAKRWDDAIAAFQKTVELDPRQAFGHFYLGILYAAKGRRQEADVELQKVLEVSNNPMLRDQAQTRIPNVSSVADLGAE